ncbi:MAG: N-acetylglucosamine-6-phosphate deacetylase [Candidatus Promineofilum sp.]|nr:N-acetylglucosamine-6-phosphate deacetylase [Promineifilum sp.]
MLAIRHATLLTPATTIEDSLVLIEDGRIAAVGAAGDALPPSATVRDAAGLLLAPGFIDLQVNGGFGLDFTADPATIWDVAAGLPRFGVTSFLPTIITSPLSTPRQAQRVLAGGPPAGWRGAHPLGLHLEGPFLNPGKKGAHNPAYLRQPSAADLNDWSPATGVRLVTLAPELTWARQAIAELARRGVVVSAGHSLATFDEAAAGFDSGARYATHLFNAMPTLHHREPGLIAAALADPRVTVGLVADGLHVHPALVGLLWRWLGPDRLNIVTDAMAALGMGPGQYLLGDYRVTVEGDAARLDDGTLAGCVLSLDAMLRAFLGFSGATAAEALPTVTTTPARLLGLGDRLGRIAPGYDADLVLLSPDLRVVETFVGGESVYRG